MVVYRQGAANGRLYRRAAYASHFQSCPFRPLHLDVNSLSILSLFYKNANHSPYIFLTFILSLIALHLLMP